MSGKKSNEILLEEIKYVVLMDKYFEHDEDLIYPDNSARVNFHL